MSPDSRYTQQIDALIPRAEARANIEAGPKPILAAFRPSDYKKAVHEWGLRWNRVFHCTMDMLAYDAGLRRLSYQVPPLEEARRECGADQGGAA